MGQVSRASSPTVHNRFSVTARIVDVFMIRIHQIFGVLFDIKINDSYNEA